MKFVVNGRTFDTATATKLAISRGKGLRKHLLGDGNAEDVYELRWEDTLYRTAKGAFFIHEHNTRKYQKGCPVAHDEATELESAEDAVKWIADNGAVIIDAEGLPLPDEA